MRRELEQRLGVVHAGARICRAGRIAVVGAPLDREHEVGWPLRPEVVLVQVRDERQRVAGQEEGLPGLADPGCDDGDRPVRRIDREEVGRIVRIGGVRVRSHVDQPVRPDGEPVEGRVPVRAGRDHARRAKLPAVPAAHREDRRPRAQVERAVAGRRDPVHVGRRAGDPDGLAAPEDVEAAEHLGVVFVSVSGDEEAAADHRERCRRRHTASDEGHRAPAQGLRRRRRALGLGCARCCDHCGGSDGGCLENETAHFARHPSES